ncbi:MAG: putative zinc metalloprotease [Candidatus Ordinivivax streblomastigis]|uniref:Zinc metalloprotease n=1 Tax=Candidatus Ordinivivax streblomastigis TaxID=2540710 RepID=A0A5M8NYY4_9BACT|nr:MAG: putative zinc metalloprotease [Candidatus Ordinivivax streblomastigis]
MEIFLIKALQLILCLSILVIVHECGHFLFAKLFKVRVEKFYLFFNPWFSLFKIKPKNSETEYGIGWLPLGGFVKIAGMIDESMDKEAMKQPPKPWEFRTKPAWQRLLIMVGGVMMNFILAFFIYSMIVLAWGDTYVPLEKTPLYFSQTGHQAGFQDGDHLLAADGKPLSRYDDLSLFRIIDAQNITVLRDGQKKTFALPENFKAQFMISKMPLTDTSTTLIDSVVPGGNAEKAGLLAGDKIISINEVETSAFNVLASQLSKLEDKDVKLEILRNQEKLALTAHVNEAGKLGFSVKTADVSITDRYNFFQSFPQGIVLGVRKLSFYVLQLKWLFTKEGAQSIGGFGAIGNLFPDQWHWGAFWTLTAFLSIMLGVMNLLPIPALDGGHVLFLLYEVITGRQPSDKFLEYAQYVGMALLFGLLIYANGMDILRAFF